MSKTTPTPTALAASGLTLLDVDPTTLGVDDQVRADATPDDDLVASVKRFGVLQPPTVYWDADREKHIVVMGHRRVGASIAAKLPSIQVLVRDAEAAKGALRLEQQLVENERREQLTPADVARGFKDMELFGLTPEDIAAAVAERPERVTAALKAHKSEKATAAMVRGIDFEQAAVIAELDGHPDLQKALADTALNEPANFAVKAASARTSAAAADKVAELTERLEGEGCPLVGTSRWHEGHWSGNGNSVPYGDGRTLGRLEVDHGKHTTCPGHAAIIHNTSSAEYAEILYVCTEWREHHDPAAQAAPELTPEQVARNEELEREREAARQRAEAFKANTTARREWLRGFIGGRLNQTGGIYDFIAAAFVGAATVDQLDAVNVTTYRIATYILTGEHQTYSYDDTPIAEMLTSAKVTGLRALVAMALATAETYADTPQEAQYSAPHLVTEYFNHLKTWGYTFSDLDTAIHGAATAGTADLDDVDTTADDEEDTEAA